MRRVCVRVCGVVCVCVRVCVLRYDRTMAYFRLSTIPLPDRRTVAVCCERDCVRDFVCRYGCCPAVDHTIARSSHGCCAIRNPDVSQRSREKKSKDDAIWARQKGDANPNDANDVRADREWCLPGTVEKVILRKSVVCFLFALIKAL